MIIRIAICGICVCILSAILKQYNKGFIIFVELAFAGVVISIISDSVIDGFKELIDLYKLSTSQSRIILCLIKGSLICIVTKLAVDVSNENGRTLVGDIIELAGRVMLIVLSLPFLESIIKTTISFLS